MSTTVFSRDMIPAADLTAADVTPAPALPEVLPPRKARGRVGMFVWRHPTIAVGGLLVFLIVAMAVFAPFLGTVDATALAPARRTRPPPDAFAWVSYWLSQVPWLAEQLGVEGARRPPAPQYWFGSDMLGRDIYSRVLYGARVSLIVGFSVAVCSSVIGMTIGLLSGFIRILDTVIMRIMDGLMSIPSILLAIALMALTRASVENVVIAITIAEVPRVSRLVRGVVLSLREQPYVEAAIASGTRVPKIIWKHILPNTLAPITVQATFICASAMITEATLSFIGAGTPPIIPSWGNIMAEGRALWQVKPYIVFFPAIFLSITVLAVNLLGDGLRDALDPRLAKRI
jgi:peptide/nickel transport system permease protein